MSTCEIPTVLDLPLTAWELVVLSLQPMDRLRLTAVNQWCRSLLVGKSFVTASVEDFHLAPAPLSRTRLYETTIVSSEQLPHGLCLEVGCDWGDERAGRAMLEDVAKFVRDRVHTFRSIRFSPVSSREHSVHSRALRYWERGSEEQGGSEECRKRVDFAVELLRQVLDVLLAETYKGDLYIRFMDSLDTWEPRVNALIKSIASMPQQPFTLHLVGARVLDFTETVRSWTSEGGALPHISSLFIEAESDDDMSALSHLAPSLQCLSVECAFVSADVVSVESLVQMELNRLTALRSDSFRDGFTTGHAHAFEGLRELELLSIPSSFAQLVALTHLPQLERLALDIHCELKEPVGGRYDENSLVCGNEAEEARDPVFSPHVRITPPQLAILEINLTPDGNSTAFKFVPIPPLYAFADCKTLKQCTLMIADFMINIPHNIRSAGDLLWVSVEHTFAPLADLPDLHSILIRGRGPDSSPHYLFKYGQAWAPESEGGCRGFIDLGSAFASRPFASARKVQVDGFRLIQCADLPRGASLQSTNDMGMRLRKGPDSVLGYEVFVHPMDRVARVGFEAWPIPPENDWDALAENAGVTLSDDEDAFDQGDVVQDSDFMEDEDGNALGDDGTESDGD